MRRDLRDDGQGPDYELGRAHLVAIRRSLILVALVLALFGLAHMPDRPGPDEQDASGSQAKATGRLHHLDEVVGADRRLFTTPTMPR